MQEVAGEEARAAEVPVGADSETTTSRTRSVNCSECSHALDYPQGISPAFDSLELAHRADAHRQLENRCCQLPAAADVLESLSWKT